MTTDATALPLASPRSAKPRKADDAYERLKRLIVNLSLPPGKLLDERTLMASLNIGRTPLREAIQRLTMEQLVTSLPRRGYYVSELSITELGEMIVAREVLEPQVARMAASNITADEIAYLRRIVNETIGRLLHNDFETSLYHDLEFHRTVAHASRNRYLETAVNQINTGLLRYWYISFSMGGFLNPTFAHHTQLIDVLETRDADLVEKMMHEHVQRFRDRMSHVVWDGSSVIGTMGRRVMTRSP